jgi:hypothetical protein
MKMFRKNINQISEEIKKTKNNLSSLEYRINNLTKKEVFENVIIKFGGGYYDRISLTGKKRGKFLFASHSSRDDSGVVTLHCDVDERDYIVIKDEYSVFCEQLKKIFEIAKDKEEEKLEKLRNELKKAANDI